MRLRELALRAAACASLLTFCAALAGCAAGEEPRPTLQAVSPPVERSRAELLLEGMTLEQKIGQLFFIRPDSLDFSLTSEQINDPYNYGVTELREGMAEALASFPAGGFVIFGKNIESAAQTEAFMAELAAASQTPVIFAADEEGGAVARIANSGVFDVPSLSSMGEIGASRDSENARRAGLTIGGYLKKLGFQLDFAPVADVNTNPDNPVIGERAFSGEPETAAEMVSAAIKGFHEAGIACCIKHYPGHGDTSADTHDGYASTDKSWQELLSCELIPFISGIDAGADLVMAAHISAPSVTGDERPASLSYELITVKLRGELGFEGVVATDSLAMGAVTLEYSPAEAALAALNAGADLLLMPESYREAYEGVLAALESGELPVSRIDESALRILRLKEEYGLLG